jgi:V/A-type H+-transporting ATPase subunit I
MVFNELASDAMEIPGVGLFFGILIFVAGHALNLLLAIVGGVVHGLRLNCIEFFSWSFNEEGRPFQAFGERARN